ncbi:hypothetical protein GCM10010360_63640 [Streptomyces nogalater]
MPLVPRALLYTVGDSVVGSPHIAQISGPRLGRCFWVACGFCAGTISVVPSARVTVTAEAGGTLYERSFGVAVWVCPLHPPRPIRRVMGRS